MTNPREIQAELDSRFTYPSKQWLYVAPWPSPSLTAEAGAGLVRGSRRPARGVTVDAQRALCRLGPRHRRRQRTARGRRGVLARGRSGTPTPRPSRPRHQRRGASPTSTGPPTVWSATSSRPRRLVLSSCSRWEGWVPTTPTFRAWCCCPNSSTDGRRVARCSTFQTSGATIRRRSLSLRRREKWDDVLATCYPVSGDPTPRTLKRRVSARLPAGMREIVRRAVGALTATCCHAPLEWMPATRYRALWPTMRAFALPSFYDGRVRLNLQRT